MTDIIAKKIVWFIKLCNSFKVFNISKPCTKFAKVILYWTEYLNTGSKFNPIWDLKLYYITERHSLTSSYSQTLWQPTFIREINYTFIYVKVLHTIAKMHKFVPNFLCWFQHLCVQMKKWASIVHTINSYISETGNIEIMYVLSPFIIFKTTTMYNLYKWFILHSSLIIDTLE